MKAFTPIYLLKMLGVIFLTLSLFSCQKQENILPPAITTLEITEITAKSALSGGVITSDGGGTIISRGIVWGTEPNPSLEQNQGNNTNNANGETFSISLSNLFPETTYYVRAFASNSAGTAYGNEVSFTTIEGVIDIDGNVYNKVTIGNQVWMAENLRTTRYRNGEPIGTTQPMSFNITNEETPKYQWPAGGSESNVATYGRLYTWHVVNDSRQVCPTGWRVPTASEWTIMEDYLIANAYNFDNTTSGNKIGKSLASATGWSASTTTGAVGNQDFPEKRNITGFSAVPAGIRYSSGIFDYMGIYSYWRSAGDVDEDSAWSHYLFYDSNSLQRIVFGKRAGFSIRCIKE